MSEEEAEVVDSAQDALKDLINIALRTCLKGEFQKAIDFIKGKDELSAHPLAQFVFSFLHLHLHLCLFVCLFLSSNLPFSFVSLIVGIECCALKGRGAFH